MLAGLRFDMSSRQRTQHQHQHRVRQLLVGGQSTLQLVRADIGLYRVLSTTTGSTRWYIACCADASCTCGGLQGSSTACHHLEAASKDWQSQMNAEHKVLASTDAASMWSGMQHTAGQLVLQLLLNSTQATVRGQDPDVPTVYKAPCLATTAAALTSGQAGMCNSGSSKQHFVCSIGSMQERPWCQCHRFLQ
jgi:hypothetical protein